MRHGFLLIDKPSGPTSHDAVQAVRRTLNEKDAGHLGTLDPLASGLLVVAVGSKALKVIELFQNLSKEYVADVRFGSVSTTYDAAGVIEKVTTKPGWQEPDQIAVRRLIDERFVGSVEQIPPAHSAVHVNGQRAYDLARRGIDPKLAARTVTIDACDIIAYDYPALQLRVACGSGTYIRSLAHDLGEMLRCGGYLSGLRRTKVGEWEIDDAVRPDEAAWPNVIPLKEVLQGLPAVEITAEEMNDISHGRKIQRELKPNTFAWFEGLPVAIMEPAKDGSRMAKPRKVL